MSRSLIAMVKGFSDFDSEGLIKGIVLNNISSMLYEKLSKEIEKNTGIKVLGYFEHNKDLSLESRHVLVACKASKPDLLSDYSRKVCQAAQISMDKNEILDQRKKAGIKNPGTIKLIVQDIR